MSYSPPRAGSKTPKLQSLWETVSGESEELCAEHDWEDAEIPVIRQPNVMTDRSSQAQRANRSTGSDIRIDRQHLGITHPQRMIVPQTSLAVARRIMRPGNRAGSILSPGRQSSLARKRPAHLDAGVEAILYGPIHGMSTPPARVQAVSNHLQSRNSLTLHGREQDMNRRLLEWQDNYLGQARATTAPPGSVSGAFSEAHTEKAAMCRIGKPYSVELELSTKTKDNDITQEDAVERISHKSVVDWEDDKNSTTPTKRKLPEPSIKLASSSKRMAMQVLRALEAFPQIISEQAIGPDWIPNNIPRVQSFTGTDTNELCIPTGSITPFTINEGVQSGQATTIPHLTTPPPSQWVIDLIQGKRDSRIFQAKRAAQKAYKDIMAVKHSQMALDKLCRERENWRRDAEAMNTSINRNIAQFRQFEPVVATRRMVKRSSFLTALENVNVQILDELQKGIPEVNSDSLGDDSWELEFTRSGVFGESDESEGSGEYEGSDESGESGESEELHFESTDDNGGEYWVDLCVPVSMGGKL